MLSHPSSTFLGLALLLVLFCSWNTSVIGTFTPIQTYSTLLNSNWQNSVRTNLCPRLLSMLSRNVTTNPTFMATALNTSTLVLGYSKDVNTTAPQWLQFDSQTGMITGGYLYKVWLSTATNLGFNIHWQEVPPVGKMSITQHARMVAPYVDFMAFTGHVDSVERRTYGLGFTVEILPANLVLVVAQQAPLPATLWTFALPFTNDLWGLLIASMILNGFFLWLFRTPKQKTKQPSNDLVQPPGTMEVSSTTTPFQHTLERNTMDYQNDDNPLNKQPVVLSDTDVDEHSENTFQYFMHMSLDSFAGERRGTDCTLMIISFLLHS